MARGNLRLSADGNQIHAGPVDASGKRHEFSLVIGISTEPSCTQMLAQLSSLVTFADAIRRLRRWFRDGWGSVAGTHHRPNFQLCPPAEEWRGKTAFQLGSEYATLRPGALPPITRDEIVNGTGLLQHLLISITAFPGTVGTAEDCRGAAVSFGAIDTLPILLGGKRAQKVRFDERAPTRFWKLAVKMSLDPTRKRMVNGLQDDADERSIREAAMSITHLLVAASIAAPLVRRQWRAGQQRYALSSARLASSWPIRRMVTLFSLGRADLRDAKPESMHVQPPASRKSAGAPIPSACPHVQQLRGDGGHNARLMSRRVEANTRAAMDGVYRRTCAGAWRFCSGYSVREVWTRSAKKVRLVSVGPGDAWLDDLFASLPAQKGDNHEPC